MLPPDVTVLVTAPSGLDSGDTAWLLASSALVPLMAPGLARFYGVGWSAPRAC